MLIVWVAPEVARKRPLLVEMHRNDFQYDIKIVYIHLQAGTTSHTIYSFNIHVMVKRTVSQTRPSHIDILYYFSVKFSLILKPGGA